LTADNQEGKAMKARLTSTQDDAPSRRSVAATDRSVGLGGSILLALAFAVTAVVLVHGHESPTDAALELRAAAAIPTASPAPSMTGAPGAGIEDAAVDAAVHQWAWEAPPRTALRPGGPYDVIELWYPSSK
jgi:hypothetical protein